MKRKKILIVGAGYMGEEYTKVLLYIGVNPKNILAVSRKKETAERFYNKYNVKCQWNAEIPKNQENIYDAAIVCVSPINLQPVTHQLLINNFDNILLEKPGALSSVGLKKIKEDANNNNANIFIAYNRRFYNSIDNAKQIIANDGGLISCFFDFTEIEERILKAKKLKGFTDVELNRWGLLNSLHVIDLFIHFSGNINKSDFLQKGRLHWHESGATFCGSGMTHKKVFFSYLSNWDGAGNWKIELNTKRHKLILSPLEKLFIQNKNSLQINATDITEEPEYLKPGLLKQVEAFLKIDSKNRQKLCTLDEAVENLSIGEKIFGYEQ